MKLYAIKHVPSGEFMPQRMSRTGFGGWSWWREPQVTPFDSTPRLFPTFQGASNALSAWMQGRWITETVTSGPWEDESTDRYPVPEATRNPRVRGDMAIVTMELSEVSS